MILAIDIGGTKIKYAYMDSIETIQRHEIDTNLKKPSDLVKLVTSLVKDKPIEKISISIPGFVDDKGYLHRAGAIKSLDEINVKALLASHLSIPVYIENDAKCAAFAELHYGSGKDINSFVMLTLGTGVGGAIVIDRHVLKGVGFRAGELGMMLSKHEGRFTSLHQLASTSALLTFYNRQKQTNIKDARLILQEYQTDTLTQSIVDDWADYVAMSIFNMSSILNPERVLLGGGISENELLLPIINKALSRIEEWSVFKADVSVCTFQNNAGLIGAYAKAVNE
ncbi:MAG TPA: ROK family protein [Erysipelothrix sp.]|nr:ROK family protein [Erysipelothrix sp.]